MMRRGSSVVTWFVTVVVVTTAVLGNDGSGGGSRSDNDTLTWLNIAVGVESVCSSFIHFCLFSS
jgi:hypothetical protein